MGKAKCATCHFVPLFNGSIPPSYLETESEIIGVPIRPDTANATLDTDMGKFHTFNRELHKNAFKTPTVRNASLTAPYMHNGAYKTLEEVIDFYNRGGGTGIGIELFNQTLPPDPLHLSKKEKEDEQNNSDCSQIESPARKTKPQTGKKLLKFSAAFRNSLTKRHHFNLKSAPPENTHTQICIGDDERRTYSFCTRRTHD